MIEWSDPLHPESAPFVLDDEAEDKEWDVFAGGLHSAVRSLNDVLAQLGGSVGPCEVRGLLHVWMLRLFVP